MPNCKFAVTRISMSAERHVSIEPSADFLKAVADDLARLEAERENEREMERIRCLEYFLDQRIRSRCEIAA